MKKTFICSLIFLSAFVYIQAQVSKTVYDYTDIAQKMTEGCSTKLEQARCIYQWLCKNISYDTTYQIYTADECWEQRKGVCQAYCELFYRLAEPLELKTQIVFGKTKDINGNISDKGHAWLYVEIDEGSILIDPTWGAGRIKDNVFIHNKNDMSWFHIDPYWLIFTHYPDDEQFQFLGNPISWETFTRLPALYPALNDFGWNAKEMFSRIVSGEIQSLPILHEQYSSNIYLRDIPMQKQLRPGRFYTFCVQKKRDERIVLIHDDEFVHETEWIQNGDTYTLHYMPVASGPLKLSVAQSKNTYNTAVAYQVSPPTTQELKNIEQHFPYKMPEVKGIKHLDSKRLEAIGISGRQVLKEVRLNNLKSLPILYKDAEIFLREVQVPLSETLEIGKTYTFSFIPQRGRDWQIINETHWHGEWEIDEKTGRWSIQVTPEQAGKLKLSVQREEAGPGGAYSTLLGYLVK